ncbi:hypothetical protein HHI36_008755 [Cryptolaemus montrouzieri]|uniref:Uncharacterized protein n=1 Tax=Cryptolaemus montrouzieri TaxID=559131 RepID=A0ABD2MTW3_9CUCU
MSESDVSRMSVYGYFEILGNKLNPLKSLENFSTYENEEKELIHLASDLLNVDELIQIFENGRSTVKGGRTSPVLRSPTLARSANKPVPKTAEALAVLVQHLVFNVEAFEVPNLRKQVKKFQFETDEIKQTCQQLEKQLLDEKQRNSSLIDEERLRWQEDVERLLKNHRTQIAQITAQKKESEEKLLSQHEHFKAELHQQYEEKLSTLRREVEKLQKTHEESLDILREENEAIREDIDAKNDEIREAKNESLKLKTDYEAKESFLKEQIQVLSRENQKFKQELALCKEEISKLEEERTRLVEENKRLLSYSEGKGVGVQEVESLRVVLELKQNEVSDLRKSLAETTQKADVLSNCEEKAAVFQARCEDLQLQLQRKNDYEMMLVAENKKMEQLLQEEANQRRNLSLRNEELQWKLKQNKEVITKILEQTSDDVFNRSGHLSTSFNNDRYSSNTSLNLSFKNFLPSVRSSLCADSAKMLKKTKNSVDDEDSPPTSPKIKGVVEKSDSVSYVLDLDESPDVVASRLVRRSFRNSVNQKNTPTKSPCNKRPRMKGSNPLSQSSSASSLISPNKVEYNRSRSVSVRNGDEDFQDEFNFSDNSSTPSYHYSNLKLDESVECQKRDDRDLDYLDDVLDLTLPALPSELGCKMEAQALPRPKLLAGEAIASESNSEDESTSSSSGQL